MLLGRWYPHRHHGVWGQGLPSNLQGWKLKSLPVFDAFSPLGGGAEKSTRKRQHHGKFHCHWVIGLVLTLPKTCAHQPQFTSNRNWVKVSSLIYFVNAFQQPKLHCTL